MTIYVGQLVLVEVFPSLMQLHYEVRFQCSPSSALASVSLSSGVAYVEVTFLLRRVASSEDQSLS